MTPELADALRERRKPFGAVTCCVDGLQVEDLIRCYSLAVELLAPKTKEGLLQCADWDWHDGYVTDPQPLDPKDWKAWAASPVTFRAAWQTEDNCHRTVYPASLDWVLRFYLWEDYENSRWADHQRMGLDFSSDVDQVSNLELRLKEAGFSVAQYATERYFSQGWTLGEGNSRTWFSRRMSQG